jgi:hypothetical protein
MTATLSAEKSETVERVHPVDQVLPAPKLAAYGSPSSR